MPTPVQVSRLTPGTEFGPYRIEGLLGEGGMGVVYRAYDPTLERLIAVKVLSEDASGHDRDIRFAHEAKAAAALNHPNICTIYRVGRALGVDYIAMELLSGFSLAARIRQDLQPGERRTAPMNPRWLQLVLACFKRFERRRLSDLFHGDLWCGWRVPQLADMRNIGMNMR